MNTKKGNLLIVDDETVILSRVSILLEDIADEIFTANNGQEGLEILKNKEVHCILCDINMPIMNGIEMIKEVRKTNSEIPFIFYTGHGNQSLMMEVVKYGAFDFLNKPALDNLEEVVQKGLKAGIGDNTLNGDSDFESEYKKLLDSIE